jgi:hypothetical protein
MRSRGIDSSRITFIQEFSSICTKAAFSCFSVNLTDLRKMGMRDILNAKVVVSLDMLAKEMGVYISADWKQRMGFMT